MFEHHDQDGLSLLVPLDGSRLAESVLPTVSYLARHCQARVTLLHIIEQRAPATVHGERHLTNAAEARAYLEEIAQRLRPEVVDVRYHVHEEKEGHVARSVVEHTRELDCNLVVLCSHGGGGLRGLLFGRIAQQVLQRGARTVWLVQPRRDGSAPSIELGRILVPLDGTPAHEPALPAAISLAHAFNAELCLAFVVPTLTTLAGGQAVTGLMLPSTMRAVLDLAGQGATDYLERTVAYCRGQGVEARGEVLRGDAVPEVLAFAERSNADLIVMASHGRAGLDALLAGSVAPRIVGQVDLPLLLLRAEEE